MVAGTSRLEDTIGAEMERSSLTGVSIALVRRGDILWSEGFGVASVETKRPLATSDPCAIMSVTKTIVSTALMQLRDEGYFQLDDPANKHLAPVRIQNEWEDESPVRIGQFMTHTSGLPVAIGGPTGKMPLAEHVAAVARTDHRPGEAIIYANWGFEAMGVLIERFSGMPVEDYLRERIFEPLGMASATLANPAPGTRHATGHYKSFVDGVVRTLPLPEWPTIPPSPAGGVWATAEDVARFVAAHLTGGGPVLSPETTAEMHRLHARQGTSDSGQGLGWRVTRSNGRRLICHGGDGGGFTGFAGAYPDEGVGVVVLLNTGGMQVARAVIANTALGLLVDAPQRTTFVAPDLAPGLYRSTFWEIADEVRDDGTMTVSEGVVTAPELSLSRLADAGGGRTEGVGGMFHGFDVTIEDGQVFGGVYPFTFVREGDLPTLGTIDENADVTGNWKGLIKTPIGPMMTTLEIKNADEAAVSTPLTPNVALHNFRAEAGQVDGEFAMTVPGIGDFHNFLTVGAINGRLVGKLYSRGDQGEVGMAVDLERA